MVEKTTAYQLGDESLKAAKKARKACKRRRMEERD